MATTARQQAGSCGHRGRGRGWSALTVVVGLTLAAAACSAGDSASGPGGTTPTGSNEPAVIAHPNMELASALQPFPGCDDLLTWVKAAATERVGPYGLPGDRYGYGYGYEDRISDFEGDDTSRRTGNPVPAPSSPPTTGSSASRPASPSANDSAGQPEGGPSATTPEHSETTVQEKGVDEPDVIKTDGRRIVSVTGQKLVYVSTTDTVPVNLGSLVLPGDDPSQLLMSGNHVLAISGNAGLETARDQSGARAPRPSDRGPTPTTLLSLIDISDPAAMKILSTVKVDGTFVSARMVDGRTRIVTSAEPASLPFVMPSSSSAGAEEAALKANRQIVADSTLEQWLPQVQIGNGTTPQTRPLFDCGKVSHPKTFSGFATVAVLSVDMGADAVNPSDAVGIMADGQTVYASTTSLYVATPSYFDPPRPSVSGTTPTTAAPAPVQLQESTSIHKFDIRAAGPAVYLASGDVEGTLLNQYSMSELDGFLRLATTSSPSSPRCARCGGTETSVRVVKEADGALTQVGQVGDMGRGEQVKAVRFLGNQGYVVTFRQTDPLYTLDLSDPTAPKLVGELALLGYSSYLHPVDDHLLIGIGKDATAQGRETGTKVSLFDMSDLANPREVQHYVLWNSTSEIEESVHAFLYWAPTKLAIIPVRRAYVGPIDGCPSGPAVPGCTGTYLPPFIGALGLTIDTGSITELGRIVNPGGYAGQPDCVRSGDCESPCPPDAQCSGRPVGTGPTASGKAPATVDCAATACTSGRGYEGVATVGSPRTSPTTPPTTVTNRPAPEPMPCDPAACEDTSTSTRTSTRTEPMCVAPDSASAGAVRCRSYDDAAGAAILRSVVVGNTLYTLSANGLKASDLTTLHEQYWLAFS